MRSLELPLGSIVMMRERVPDGVYSLKMGMMGMFDKMNRLLAVIYKDEFFGLESLYGMKSQFEIRSISNVDMDIYDPDEFRSQLDLEKKGATLNQIARRLTMVERRNGLTAEVRMRDILREMLDNGVPKDVIESLPLSLGANDSLAYERVVVELGI